MKSQPEDKVTAHLVSFQRSTVVNPCGEIDLPILMKPKDITMYRLMGHEIFDYTESLGMSPELVYQDQCWAYIPEKKL